MTDTRNPMEITDDFWIRAANPATPEDKQEGIYTGKWMLFIYPDNLPETWAKIREATESGKLGTSAKSATARENPNAQNKAKLICVYTYDCRNMNDVRRVLAELRSMGFQSLINYKEDIATYARTYGTGASLYTSRNGTNIKVQRKITDPETLPDDIKRELGIQ